MNQEEQDPVQVTQKYHLSRRLGQGSFGEVFLATDTITKQEVAIKIESADTEHPQLSYESKVLKMLNENVSACQYSESVPETYFYSFPRILSSSQEQEQNVMVMERLGPSLQDIFYLFDHKFSLKTTLMVALEMLNLLEALHAQRFLHRDIKPSNYAIGKGSRSNVLYMMDFGLAKKYMDREGRHMACRENKKFVGNVKYCSINAHLGMEQSRRDDLESLCYVLLHLAKGTLPWQSIKGHSKEEKYEKIQKSKMKQQDALSQGVPVELVNMLLYAKSLLFEQQPDYDMLRTTLHQLATNQAITVDHRYDWNTFIKSHAQFANKTSEEHSP